MSKIVFDVVYADFDWKEHFFLEGPEGTTSEEFKKLCNRLLPKAGYRAALKSLSPKQKGWIGWRDVVESLVSLLEQRGYQRVSLETVEVSGGNIVGIDDEEDSLYERLEFSGPLLAEYNRKLEKRLTEERKLRKFSSLKKKVTQIIK